MGLRIFRVRGEPMTSGFEISLGDKTFVDVP